MKTTIRMTPKLATGTVALSGVFTVNFAYVNCILVHGWQPILIPLLSLLWSFMQLIIKHVWLNYVPITFSDVQQCKSALLRKYLYASIKGSSESRGDTQKAELRSRRYGCVDRKLYIVFSAWLWISSFKQATNSRWELNRLLNLPVTKRILKRSLEKHFHISDHLEIW